MGFSRGRIENIGLIVKSNDDLARLITEQITLWLEKRGLKVYTTTISGDTNESDMKPFRHADLVLSVGGDGTMLSIARRLVGSGIPLAGVNLGRVGFLPELSRDNWKKSLSDAFEHGIVTEKRMALECAIIRNGTKIYSGVAVNDVVLSRGGLARLLAMDITIDSEKLLYLRSDGFIISTPTGSTAYSSSAGGPLLHPSLNVYSATAICPFMSHPTPLVIGADVVLCVQVRETSAKTFVTVDGQELIKMLPGDELITKGVPEGILFANFGLLDYFDKLKSSGIVTDSPGGCNQK